MTAIWLVLKLGESPPPSRITPQVDQPQQTMALVVPDKNAFQHILRLLNTNVRAKENLELLGDQEAILTTMLGAG